MQIQTSCLHPHVVLFLLEIDIIQSLLQFLSCMKEQKIYIYLLCLFLSKMFCLGAKMWYSRKHSKLDEVQSTGKNEQEVPYLQTFQVKRHPQTGRCQQCRHQELAGLHADSDRGRLGQNVGGIGSQCGRTRSFWRVPAEG